MRNLRRTAMLCTSANPPGVRDRLGGGFRAAQTAVSSEPCGVGRPNPASRLVTGGRDHARTQPRSCMLGRWFGPPILSRTHPPAALIRPTLDDLAPALRAQEPAGHETGGSVSAHARRNARMSRPRCGVGGFPTRRCVHGVVLAGGYRAVTHRLWPPGPIRTAPDKEVAGNRTQPTRREAAIRSRFRRSSAGAARSRDASPRGQTACT